MPGVKGKSGRKTKAQELGLVALLDKCWSMASRERCITKLAEDCESEEFHVRNESRRLLLAYTFGKPKESVEHSGKDGEAFEIVVKHVTGSS